VRGLLNINLVSQIFKWTSICSLLWVPALFFTNKSLWVDEFLLALNFIDHDWQHLLKPLDYRQMAPIGFLLSSKCFAVIFSNQDTAFKIIPAIGWLGSWFVFKSILEHFNVSKVFLWGSMALFSSNFILLSYSYEFKQYSTDVVFALLIFLIYLRIKDKTATHSWLKFGLLLSVSLLFSNVAIVVMSALAFLALIKEGKKFFSSIFFKVLAVQALVFGLYFFTFLYQHPTENYMLQYWGSKNAFFPSPSVSSFIYHKIQITLSVVFNNKYIGIGFLTISAVCIYCKRKIAFFELQNISIIIIAIHLGLSALKKYPFENRFILYFIPFILLSFACLYNNTEKKFQNNKKKAQLLHAAVIAMFFIGAINGQFKNFKELLYPKEDLKSLMIELEKKSMNVDHIYVSEGAEVGFLYYRHFYPNTFELPYSLAKNKTYKVLLSEKHSNIALLFSHYSPFDEKESLFEKDVTQKSDVNQYKLKLICKSERSKLFLAKKEGPITEKAQ
jgi:hypothetical protein